MALLAKTISFTQKSGGTGGQSVTGVGFQPSVVILMASERTADGTGAGFRQCIGMASGSTNRGCVWMGSKDNVATSACGRSLVTNRVLQFASETANTTPTLLADADFSSLDSDGFSLNWWTNDNANRIIVALCLGGSDLNAAYVGTFTTGTALGNQSVTGVGFRPDGLLLLSHDSGSTGLQLNATTTIGAVASPTERAVMVTRSRDNQATKSTIRYENGAKAISIVSSSANSVISEADFSSFDSDGFSINWTTIPASHLVLFLAVKGCNVGVGSFSGNTTTQGTGTQGVTGLGFKPKALMLFSHVTNINASVQTGARRSVGVATSTSERGCLWLGDANGGSTSIVNQNLDRTKVVKSMSEATSAGATLNAAADFSSFDQDGFSVSWSTVDASARDICYLAFGDAPSRPAMIPPPAQHGFQIGGVYT